MAIRSPTQSRMEGHRSAAGAVSPQGGGKVASILLAVGAVIAIALAWRGYQQMFAFTKGLDKHSVEYSIYWMPLMVFNTFGLPIITAGWFLWMWRSAGRLPSTMTRAEEAGRIWRLWLLVAAFTVAVYWGGSYYAEEDASWHQVVMRDTAFTPSHVVLFYGVFPLMIYLAAGAYLYARTRLPHLYGGRGFPVSFALMIGGSLLLLFQVAMNEFGHSFFQPEEVFAAPLHWPFVLFAYLLAGTFACWFETAPRLFELSRQERALQQRSVSVESSDVNVATGASS